MKAFNDATWPAPATTVGGAAVPDQPSAGPSGRTRTGKIGRLPHPVREALNKRLRNGAPFAEIAAWLNGLPVVGKVLQERFHGSAISADNVSKWHLGGYKGWVENEESREAVSVMSAACRKIDQGEREDLTSQIGVVMTARMVVALQRHDRMPEGARKSAAWRDLMWSFALLRRGRFDQEKLRLERDKFAEAGKAPQWSEEEWKSLLKITGVCSPDWTKFTKRREGKGAEEMREQEEVDRLVLEEMRRRKAARAAAAPPASGGD